MSESSKLFEEFIMRRCEEITQEDGRYREICACIAQLEEQVKKSAPKEVLLKLQAYSNNDIRHSFASFVMENSNMRHF